MKNIHNNITLYFTLLIFAFMLAGCDGFQEEIVPVNISVDNVKTIVVINAEIEKDSTAWLQISYSEDINAVAGTPVRYEEDAIVTLETTGSNSEVLDYTSNGMYLGNSIFGTVGESYTLTVDINGQIYTATSTMFPDPGYQSAWVEAVKVEGKETSGAVYYDGEWIVNDPSDERNHYLFEWHTNGIHNVRIDWCIDDNRVVNVNEGLRLFNPTIRPGANEHVVFRAAEIDKPTYNYYNMYEKIVRGLIGSDSQTPYNPISNFGDGTMGNFRAVSFSSIVVLTPPNTITFGQNEQIVLAFLTNDFFAKYNLYWRNTEGVTKDNSNVITDISLNIKNSYAFYSHTNISNGTAYYYRIEVEDAEGNTSILSPEVLAIPKLNVPIDDTPDIVEGGNDVTNVVAVTGNNTGEIIISWDEVIDDKIVYGIYWDTSSGIDSNLPKENQIWSGKDGDVSSPFTMTGLGSGTTYYFKVAIWDGSSVSLSEEVSAIAK